MNLLPDSLDKGLISGFVAGGNPAWVGSYTGFKAPLSRWRRLVKLLGRKVWVYKVKLGRI